MEISLSVEDLKAYYFTSAGTVKAVDGVNFALNQGESVGIAGESACGKSTLGMSIMRMLQPPGRIVDGKILLDGNDILAMGEQEFNRKLRWKRVAVVFQGAMNALDPVYSVRDQLTEVMKYHNYPEDKMKERMIEVVSQVGLHPSVIDRYPHELSGGMKQRIMIAMALILRPKLLIADEPTTALDVLVQAQIINLLKKLKEEYGMTIMLITHDLAIVSEIAEKVGIMYAGQLVEFGSAEQIYKEPKHPYTKALIAAIPRLRGEKKLTYVRGAPPNLLNAPKGCRFYDRCPHAMDICRRDPPMIRNEDGFVGCWLYDEGKAQQ